MQRINRLLSRAEEMGWGQAAAAPIDVVLHPEQSAVQPDLLFIARDRLHTVHAGVVAETPDLVVEVLSDTTRRRDLGLKLHLYEGHGVPFYWAVDPEEEAVRVYVRRGGGYGDPAFLRPGGLLGCPLFPAVTMPVEDVFAG